MWLIVVLYLVVFAVESNQNVSSPQVAMNESALCKSVHATSDLQSGR